MQITHTLKNYLKELGFKEHEISVYLALTQLGESTAAIIAKKADLPRTTVISILQKLAEENYLTTHVYRKKTFYWVESPNSLVAILENKIETAHKLESLLSELYRSEAHFPYAKVYDTKKGIRKFIESLLSQLDKKSIIYTVDTPDVGNYSKIYSGETGQMLVALKQKREIMTHTLVPFGSYKKISTEKIKQQRIVIKELPRDLHFTGSLWIVQDMIVHFSGTPPFIVAIKHETIVQGVKGIYHFLWNVAKEIE